MKTIVPFFLLFILTISCKQAVEHHQLTGEASKEAEVIVNRTLAKTEKFDELPLLANYINELVPIIGFSEGTSSLLKLENQLIKLDENSMYMAFDYNEIDTFSLNYVSISGNSHGTSYSAESTTQYVLLKEGPEPTVLVTRLFGDYIKDSHSEVVAAREELETELAEQGVEESKIANIIDKMDSRSGMNPITNLSNTATASRISFWVFQKKVGKWQNISKNVFATTMPQEFVSHFPFFEMGINPTEKLEESISFKEVSYSKSILLANKTNWLSWFGISDLKNLNLCLDISGDDILLKLSKNKSIRWEWDGSMFLLKNLPAKVEWVNTPCPKINFTTAGSYKFNGKIGDEHNIEMQVKISSAKGKTTLQGEYWYINEPDSRFPLVGTLSNKADSFTFYRTKSGKNRESFDCYFDGCTMVGWWQHLGNMDIFPVSLELQ